MRRLTPSLVALVVGAAMNLFPAATGAMTKDTLNALLSFSLFILCEKWRIRLMNVSKKKKRKVTEQHSCRDRRREREKRKLIEATLMS